MRHRRAFRFAVWAYALMMLTPGGLGAQSPEPPPSPAAAVPGTPPLPTNPAVGAIDPPPLPPPTLLASIQQHRQQRLHQRQDRRQHLVQKMKSLLGLGS